MTERSYDHAFTSSRRASRWLTYVPIPALALLLGTIAMETWFYWTSRDLLNLLSCSYTALEQQQSFPAALAKVSTTTHGSLLTPEPVFLEQFTKATKAAVKATFTGYLMPITATRGQVEQQELIQKQVCGFLSRWKETFELSYLDTTVAAAASQRKNENRNQRAAMLERFKTLSAGQRQLAEELKQGNRWFSLLTHTLSWMAPTTALAAVVLTWTAMRREIRRRCAAEARLQETNADLERRVAERTAILEDREQRLQAIVNTAIEGIITIDARGVVESMNHAAEKMFGYCADEIVGRNVSQLMPEPHRSEHDRYLSRYLASGQARIIGVGRELVGQRKDGTLFPLHLSISEVSFGAVKLFVGLIRDLTENKRLERQAVSAAEQERGRIARDLHDGLGQQLGGALFLSSLLHRDLKERNAPEAARAAEIHELIKQALADVRNICRGLYPVPPEPDGLMTALQNLADRVTRDCGIDCCFHANSAVLLDDPAAASHWYRLAQEAVSNAVKYSGSTRIDILLDAAPYQLQLVVRDYGKGLPAGSQPGLGMQTMQRRAQELGGQLTVENAPDGGVEVRCVAPFYRSQPAAKTNDVSS
jgi:PAS domain S-box-containing protein